MLNMERMVVTADTFHALISWLKEEASSNMERMVVTADTFHALMSWLKESAQ